jgi:hypothetical protein
MNNNATLNHQTNQLDQDTLEIYAVAYQIGDIFNYTLEYENEISCAYEFYQNTLQDVKNNSIIL